MIDREFPTPRGEARESILRTGSAGLGTRRGGRGLRYSVARRSTATPATPP